MRTDAVAAVSFANYGARRSAATATLARCVEDSGLPAPRTLEAIRICGGRKSGVHALSPQGGGARRWVRRRRARGRRRISRPDARDLIPGAPCPPETLRAGGQMAALRIMRVRWAAAPFAFLSSVFSSDLLLLVRLSPDFAGRSGVLFR